MKQWNNKIIKVLKYFSFFAYYPTSEEIHAFLQAKINKNSLNTELERMTKLKIIGKCRKYTPPQYSIKQSENSKYPSFAKASEGRQISKRKLNNIRFRLYKKLISLFPQIKLVGLSGSISMMNAEEGDDIDLFIITAKNRLFTGRLITLVLAQLLGLRRSRDSEIDKKARYQKFFDGKQQTAKNLVSSLYNNKVCLNLFFDESNMKVPKFKQTEFVGHEVLQMKPILNKEDIYKRFLEVNNWVFELFPNSKSKIRSSNVKSNPKSKAHKFEFKILGLIYHLGFVIWVFNKIEQSLKNFQLRSINEHKTTEIITTAQLWFHPDDFEKKIKI